MSERETKDNANSFISERDSTCTTPVNALGIRQIGYQIQPEINSTTIQRYSPIYTDYEKALTWRNLLTKNSVSHIKQSNISVLTVVKF